MCTAVFEPQGSAGTRNPTIGNCRSQKSQSLDRATTRESQTHDVGVCGAWKAYNMVAKRVSNNQFRDAKLNKRSTTVLCWS